MPGSVQSDVSEGIRTIYIMQAKILDDLVIDQVYRDIIALVDKTEEPALILDFRQVQFMSSSALGMLIRLNKRCKDFKVALKLSGISPDIRQVFDITGLNKIFEIHSDAQSARDAFIKKGSLFRR